MTGDTAPNMHSTCCLAILFTRNCAYFTYHNLLVAVSSNGQGLNAKDEKADNVESEEKTNSPDENEDEENVDKEEDPEEEEDPDNELSDDENEISDEDDSEESPISDDQGISLKYSKKSPLLSLKLFFFM